MKKTILTLIALLLIASLPACSRRKEFEEQRESLEASKTELVVTMGEEPTESTVETIVLTPMTRPVETEEEIDPAGTDDDSSPDTSETEAPPIDTPSVGTTPPESTTDGTSPESAAAESLTSENPPPESEESESPTQSESDATTETDPPDTSNQVGIPVPPETVDKPDPDDPLPNDTGYRLNAMHKDGDTGYYEGKTIDEIKDMFWEGHTCYGRYVYNTPTGMIFQPRKSTLFYSKLTGNVSAICPDPLCDGKDRTCPWYGFSNVIYCTRDHIYFNSHYGPNGQNANATAYVYRCDTERNHVEFLYEADGSSVNSNIWLVEGNRIYTSQYIYRENDSAVWAFGYVDTETGEFTALSGDLEAVYVSAVVGGKVYYSMNDGKYYRADLDFDSDSMEEFLSYLPHKRIQSYNDTYMIIRKDNGVTSQGTYLYNLKTDELFDLNSTNLHSASAIQLSGDYIYYIKNLTDAEIEESPLKSFWTYSNVIKSPYGSFDMVGGENLDAGRLYRLNLKTLESELVFQMSYNGIPILLFSFQAEGDTVFINYLTYLDYNNFYNQEKSPGGVDSSRMRDPFRQAFLDFSNGEVRLVEVDPDLIDTLPPLLGIK